MKKIVIYGAGIAGKYVYNCIVNAESDLGIVCWIDNFVDTANIIAENVPIYTEKEFLEISNNEIILITMQNEIVSSKCVASLLNRGIKNIYILNSHVIEGQYTIIENKTFSTKWISDYKNKRPVLDYLEYQVADSCNLKCRRCSHFSNLICKNPIADLSKFEHDLIQLKLKFSNIKEFRLLGGEPLLNENLSNFIMSLHNVFPLTDIHIVTNGLMIPKMSDKLIRCMNICSAIFDISQYPPTKKILSEIVDILEKNDIRYNISSPIVSFYKILTYGGGDYKDIFLNHCRVHHYCKFLRNGKIYACAQIPLLFEMKDYFGFSISENEFEKNGIPIDTDMSGWDILCRLENPFSLCRFCSRDHSKIAWEISKKENIKYEDWIGDI